MRISKLLFAAWLLGCASASPQATDSSGNQFARAIEVRVPLPPSKTADLIQAAALRGGWGVASLTERLITLDTYKPKGNELLNIQLRANIMGNGSGSTVMINGQWGSELEAALLGPAANRGNPNQVITGPPFKRLNNAGRVSWAELERFATAVKAAVAESK